MTQNGTYKTSTKKFFSILKEGAEQTAPLPIKKVIDKLRHNIYVDSDENINLDFQDIETCFKETTQGIIQVVETNNLSLGLDKIINDSISKINTKNLLQHIVLHFTLHPSISILDIATSMDSVHDVVHEEADVCFCISYNHANRIDHIEIDSFIFY